MQHLGVGLGFFAAVWVSVSLAWIWWEVRVARHLQQAGLGQAPPAGSRGRRTRYEFVLPSPADTWHPAEALASDMTIAHREPMHAPAPRR